jgi:type IV pilus assembly protein PilW
MVALAIGSLLMIGAVTVYMQTRTTYRTTETAARTQEVARFALDIVESDVRLAGYWGLTSKPIAFDDTSRGRPTDPRLDIDKRVTDNCDINWIVDVWMPVDGRDAADTGGTGYDLDCSATAPVDWADVLIVRRATSETTALTANRAQVQSSRIRAVIFDDGVLPAGFDATASETHDLLVHAYYVSEVLPSPNGVRQFALRRQTLVTRAGSPTVQDDEVIPGVEDLQVQFGVDAGPIDGNVDRYVDPGTALPAGAVILSARIWLRVIAEDREMGFKDETDWTYANADYGVLNDDRRRVLISKTIRIRNSQ